MGICSGVFAGIIGYDMAVAHKPPLIDHQAFQSHGAAGVNFAGADPHFRAQAEPEPV